ncbi:MAG TPA: YggT family protein [Novosphingobium sp.]|nr:YggT family protein [Novosphingobium sp.]
MLYALIDVIGYLVQIIIMLVILQFVLGLLMAFNVVNPHNEVFGALWRTCNQLLDPLLRPIQKIMPDTRPIDLSPMVLIIGLSILQRVLHQAAMSGLQ